MKFGVGCELAEVKRDSTVWNLPDPQMEAILSSDLDEILVRTDTGCLESFR